MSELFDVPPRYCLSHSVGCPPRALAEYMERHYTQPWREKGGDAWPHWMGKLAEFRAELAAFLGTEPANVCPQSNVSSALTKILFSLPIREGKSVIVLSAQDFPTIGFVLKQAEHRGYRLRFVDGDPADLKNWNAAMDDDVALVHITHVLSNTSARLPVADIACLAHQYGAFRVIDIAQSVGVVAIDLSQWMFDFVIGSCVKFICGGPGAGFLVASNAMLKHCTPIDVGWFSHKNPFEMDINDFRYAGDAMKFFGGTPSPAPFIAALCSLQTWQAIGIETIAQRVQDGLDRLSDSVPDPLLVSSSARKSRGGTLVVAPKDRAPLRARLHADGFVFDERAEGIRLSVHAYTPDSDIADLAKLLKSTL